MKKCRITVMRITEYRDLMEQYECAMENACDMHAGQTFIANGWKKPERMEDASIRILHPWTSLLSQRVPDPIGETASRLSPRGAAADAAAHRVGLCDSAWETMSPFVLTLACGGRGIYGKWMTV